MLEKRRYPRTSIDLPVLFTVKGEGEGRGTGKDISIGGMFVETDAVVSFGAEVAIRVRLRTPNGDQEFTLPGIIRWVRDGGMGVQFGLLGALETHAITELAREAGG